MKRVHPQQIMNCQNKSTPFPSAAGRVPLALLVAIISLPFITPTLVEGQSPPRNPPVDIQVFEPEAEPQAVVVAVLGQCDYSEDGNTFAELKTGQVLKEGAVVRTGEDARADIFFRRIGITVRLQPDSEIKLEKMTRRMKDGNPELNTLLDLRKGRIFTVVRTFIQGSTFEVRNAAGRSVIEGGGVKGRYIITADGTHVTDKNSDVPIKVVGETGVTIVAPGKKYSAKEGKLLPLDTPESVLLLIEFDEIHALAEKWDQPQAPENLRQQK